MVKKIENINYDVLPVVEYDMLGANIVKMMLNNIFENRSMVRLKKNISEDTLMQIPIFKMILDYMHLIEKEEEIKLTKIGNIPPRYVKELYENNEIKEYQIEKLGSKLKNEQDSDGIIVARVLAKICKYTKIRKNILSLTKTGKESLRNKALMFEKVISVFTKEYNWSYLDWYEQDIELSELVSYNYYLVGKYGKIQEDYTFYVDKTLEAFPVILEMINIKAEYDSEKRIFEKINFKRTFEGYMEYLGLVVCEKDWKNNTKKIKKTDLFEKIIDLSAINNMIMYNKEEIRKHNLHDLVSKLDYKRS